MQKDSFCKVKGFVLQAKRTLFDDSLIATAEEDVENQTKKHRIIQLRQRNGMD